MHDKNLHITKKIEANYPVPDIPADEAWATMNKMLDDNTPKPPLPPVPPNGNNAFWKYGLVLLFIAGILIYINSHKQRQAQTASHKENTGEQKVQEPGSRKGEQQLGENDSTKGINNKNNTAFHAPNGKDTDNNNSSGISSGTENSRKKGNTANKNNLKNNNASYPSTSKNENTVAQTNNSLIAIAPVNKKNKRKVNDNGLKRTLYQNNVASPAPKGNDSDKKNISAIPSETQNKKKNKNKVTQYNLKNNKGSLTAKNTKNTQASYYKKSRAIASSSNKKINSAINTDTNLKISTRIGTGNYSDSIKGEIIRKRKNKDWDKEKNGIGTEANSPVTKKKDLAATGNSIKLITESNINGIEEKKFDSNKANQTKDNNLSKNNDTIATTNNSVASVLPNSQKLKSSNNLKNRLPATQNFEKNKKNSAVTKNDGKKNKNIALAAGLGLNQFFTVGGQQKADYNSSGTSGVLSDYIPVPMLRVYFNKKLYVQLEEQFNTPQYTKNVLAKQVIILDSVGPTTTANKNSVFIKKLFYFNLPLSVHYSLFKNFYVGAGAEFSRLSNGVGLFEETKLGSGPVPDSLVSSKIKNFKSDSVYKEIRTKEWRFLLDANYQSGNLIFGIRYNQALSNFINVQISNSQVTQARNSSIQLYLRYIIWKTKKTKELFAK